MIMQYFRHVDANVKGSNDLDVHVMSARILGLEISTLPDPYGSFLSSHYVTSCGKLYPQFQLLSLGFTKKAPE